MIARCLTFIIGVLGVLRLSANELLVVTENWPPYNFRSEERIVGASTDIVKKTLDKTNYKYNIHLYPWARSYEIALNKPNVIIYTILRTPQREPLFKWVGPLFSGKQFYLYKLHTRTDVVLSNIDDAKKYIIGIMRGDVSHQFFSSIGITESNGLNITISEEENIRKLFNLKIDLISGNNISLPIRMKKLGYDFNDINPVIMTFKYDYYMAVSKSTSDTVYTKINDAFKNSIDENFKNTVIKKYGISH
ncbi:substrate-binding periplasmic protein [Spartinivicinus ruber]|uniref:substrate-binding periplasmic protein n=1 Tax=Spartinivicinus ruber TaxID=2683272 RepID=UPI001CA3B47A|nr:transporter substrate-binding domain-containing protein [Spartinivicinus ruber]